MITRSKVFSRKYSKVEPTHATLTADVHPHGGKKKSKYVSTSVAKDGQSPLRFSNAQYFAIDGKRKNTKKRTAKSRAAKRMIR